MKILLFDFNNLLIDVAEELIKRGHTLLPIDGKKSTWKAADTIIVWNETELGGWRDWIKEAKDAGKRVILMQHGRRGTSRIFPPFNEDLISDVVCSWGINDVIRLSSCGVPAERIRLTGTTIFRHLKPRVPHEGWNIIWSPEHWDIDVAENFIIKNQLEKLDGVKFQGKTVKVISKLLLGEHSENTYPNPVWSDRKEAGHLEICAEVLSTADVLVAVSESTFELLAEVLDIPVVIADIWVPKACNGDERYREYHREYSDACERVKDLGKLNEVIMRTLRNPEKLSAERKRISILDGGTDIENPLQEIINVIENL